MTNLTYASVTNALLRPYGGRTMSYFTKSYGRRTVAVRFLRAPYGRRSFFTHRTMPLEVLTRSYNFSRRRTMFQPQTASCKVAGLRPYGRRIIFATISSGHRTVAVRSTCTRRTVTVWFRYNNLNIERRPYGGRTVTIRWPYGRRRIILVKHKGIVRSPHGHRTVAVLSPYGGRAGNAE